MMRRNLHLLLLFCFLLGNIQMLAQTKYIDSLTQELSNSSNEEEYLAVLSDLITALNLYGTEGIEPYILETIALAQKLGSIEQLGYAYVEYGDYFYSKNTKDSANYYYNQALEAFKLAGSQAGEAIVISQFAAEAEWDGDFPKAMEYEFQAIKILEEIGDELGVNNSYVSIANILGSMGRYEEARTYLDKCKPPIMRLGASDDIALFLLTDGQSYFDLDQFEKSKEVYRQLRDLAKKEGFTNDVITSSTRLGDLALELRDTVLAQKEYQTACDYAANYGYEYFTHYAHMGLGLFYLETENYDSALIHYQIALEHQEETFDYFSNPLNEELGRVYAGLGNYEQAYAYQRKYAIQNDSFFQERSQKIAQEAEVIYKVEQKDAEIQKTKKEQRLLILILSAFILMAILLFRAYQQKQRTNLALAASNEEKEFLIKEIHHRVKNNLQTLSSLLSLQADYINDPKALDAVTEGRNRVQTMGLLHQKLYQGENLAAVDMNQYIKDLSEHLLESYGTHGKIRIRKEISVSHLDINSAIPLGLIINELITNSLKYAFPDAGEGLIEIKLWERPEKILSLIVKDNGQGVVEKVTPSKESTSFGRDLIFILSKKLKGIIKERTAHGYETQIDFHRYEIAKSLS